MKKFISIGLLFTVLLILNGCSNVNSKVVMNKSQNTNEEAEKFKGIYSGLKKSESEIRAMAYNYIDKNEIGLPNWESVKNVKVEEYKEQRDHLVINSGRQINLIGKEAYRVSFDNGNPSKLGPITVYLDKNFYKFLGVDIRE
jgi:hypothetical protein